ncbi:MAG TPA: DUF5666 domain-containing protein [Steroidobacteraceae bacterium]|nr:DUF5666 domain-containing protein [Steroidobacteraceae bacterium]
MSAMDRARTALVAVLLAVTACGGSGGSNNLAGIEGTGFAQGVITGFGSIFVNGIEFSTTGASITIDGRGASESELRVGQVVTIAGQINSDGRTGSATSVTVVDQLEGPVLSIDLATNSFVAMGRTVYVDGATSFNSGLNSLADLHAGDVVEVSGFLDASGYLRATRIERNASGGEYEVTGTITAVDTVLKVFQIGTLSVDYSAAALDDLPGGAPAVGQVVEAKGTTFSAAGALLATRVQLADEDQPGNGATTRIEGYVTRFASTADFDVDGQRVQTGAGTSFDNGTAADLALNVKVEVDGMFNNGALAATRVSFRSSTEIRLTTSINSIDATNSSFTALGVVVQTNSLTRFEDKLSQPVSPFGFAQLRIGDYVEVRGSGGPVANSIVAAIVERDEPRSRIELRGLVQGVADPAFTILGVLIQTDAGTQFPDSMTAAEFFAQANGRLVSVGALVGGVLVADEIEFED